MVEREMHRKSCIGNDYFEIKGGILADDVGLGKTIMMLETMKENLKENTLIIVPKSLQPQWKTESEKYNNIFKVDIFDESYEYNWKHKFRILIVSQSKFNSRSMIPEELLAMKWDRIVIDEAHCIKNKRSKIHKTCCLLNTDIRWALTATPVCNNMFDFVYILKWVGIEQEYCQNYKDVVSKEFVLRRTKEDVKPLDIKCNTNIHKLEFDCEHENTLYKDVFDEMKKKMLTMKKRGNKNAFEALELLLRIRQVCCHPQSLYTSWKMGTWKYGCTKVRTIIKAILQTPKHDKCLIFCHFIAEMDGYCNELQNKKISYNVLNGTMDIDTRYKNVEEFRKDSKVLVVQIQTGGVGYNLQVANHVYITSPTWNPSIQHQIIGRAYRNGQQKDVDVNIYTIGSKDGIYVEEYMLSLQQRKREMIADLLNDSRLTESEYKNSNISFSDITKVFT